MSKSIGDTAKERRAARAHAKTLCRTRRAELKQALPVERKTLAALIATARADFARKLATLRAESADRVRKMREAAKLRSCVDLHGGPLVRRFGPKRPKHIKRAEGKRTKAKREKRSASFNARLMKKPFTITGGGDFATLAAAEAAAKSAARSLKQPIRVSERTGSGWRDHGTWEPRGAVVVRAA